MSSFCPRERASCVCAFESVAADAADKSSALGDTSPKRAVVRRGGASYCELGSPDSELPGELATAKSVKGAGGAGRPACWLRAGIGLSMRSAPPPARHTEAKQASLSSMCMFNRHSRAGMPPKNRFLASARPMQVRAATCDNAEARYCCSCTKRPSAAMGRKYRSTLPAAPHAL